MSASNILMRFSRGIFYKKIYANSISMAKMHSGWNFAKATNVIVVIIPLTAISAHSRLKQGYESSKRWWWWWWWYVMHTVSIQAIKTRKTAIVKDSTGSKACLCMWESDVLLLYYYGMYYVLCAMVVRRSIKYQANVLIYEENCHHQCSAEHEVKEGD